MNDVTYFVDTAANETVTTWGTLTISGERRDENMRGLYRIIVVDPKSEEIVGPIFVIAKDESGALLKADLPQGIRSYSDHYDFIVDRLGDVRAKKDVQKVKVVKEDEE